MKELEPHKPEKIELRVNQQQRTGIDYVGTFIKHPGHTIWELNLKTQEINPAEFSEEYIEFGGGVKKKIVSKPQHWYCSALNKKSAFRKFNQMAKIFVEKQQVKNN